MSRLIEALAENHRAIEALVSELDFDINDLARLTDARQAIVEELAGDGEALAAAATLQPHLEAIMARALENASRRLASLHGGKRALDAYRR